MHGAGGEESSLGASLGGSGKRVSGGSGPLLGSTTGSKGKRGSGDGSSRQSVPFNSANQSFNSSTSISPPPK